MSADSWQPFGHEDSYEAPASALDALFAGRSAPAPVESMKREPARSLIVVTCMDARIDPIRALGLQAGDAHIIRNAGVLITDDVLRSIEVSRVVMATENVPLLGHTDCAAYETTDQVRAALREALPRVPGRAAAALYDLVAGRLEPIT
jgi:carbonic anhydrase